MDYKNPFIIGPPIVLSAIVIFVLVLYLLYTITKRKCDEYKKKYINDDIKVINQLPTKEEVVVQQNQKYLNEIILKNSIILQNKEDNGIVNESNNQLNKSNINNQNNQNNYGIINNNQEDIYPAELVTINQNQTSFNYFNDTNKTDTKIDIEQIYSADPVPDYTSEGCSIADRNNNCRNNGNTKLGIETMGTTEYDPTNINNINYDDCSLPSYNEIYNNDIKDGRQDYSPHKT